jgi:ELWxxDGT repeat protein
MKKSTMFIAGLILPLSMMAQNLPKGLSILTGSTVTVTSENDRSGIKKNPFVVAGGKLFFTAKTTANGDELWVSDGTAAGTKMVKDINPGNGSASPRFLVEMGGKVYFQADDGTYGVELWVSDGTDAGTTMIKDLYTGSNSSAPELLTPVGSNLLFSASSAASDADGQKWLYWYKPADGSVTLVKSGVQAKNTGDSNYKYIIANSTKGVAYFIGQPKGLNDEVWVTDGTDAGTHVIKDICPEALGASNIQWLYNFNDEKIVWREKTPRGYANAYGGDSTLYKSHLNEQVWVSDGTEAGTHLLKFIDKTVDATSGEGTSTQFAWPTTYKNKLYFRADDGSHGVELWVSDMSGDTSKTQLFKDNNPGGWASWPEDYAIFKGYFCFDSDAGGSSWGAEPSYTDGTLGQINNIADLQPGNAASWSSRLKVLQINGRDSLLFGVGSQPNIGQELWMVKDFVSGATGIDLGPGDSNPYDLTPMNNALYFTSAATGLQSLFKYTYTPVPIVKFKTSVVFDNSNYNTPQPLVIFKDNLSSFVDPQLKFTCGKELKLSNTKNGSYNNGVYLSSNATDTIWVKVWALNPDSSFRNLTISAQYKDKSDNSVSTATATIKCNIEPVFRADLLYLVECGRVDSTTVEPTEKLGKYQRVVDQAFKADTTVAGTHSWGYENSTWAKTDVLRNKWGGGVREPAKNLTDPPLNYKFQVENGDYIVQLGSFENWGGRTTKVAVNDQPLDSIVTNGSDNKVMRFTKVTVTGGLITVSVSYSGHGDNAEISWIKVGKVVAGTTCFDTTCQFRDREYATRNATNPSGIKQSTVSQFSVYPNPSNGLVTVKVAQNEFDTYQVFSYDGKLISNSQIKANQTEVNIDLTNNAGGLYFIQLKGKNGTASQKIIVE